MATKKTVVKKVKTTPLVKKVVDTSELKVLQSNMQALVPGSGSVDERQALVDKLECIIKKLES